MRGRVWRLGRHGASRVSVAGAQVMERPVQGEMPTCTPCGHPIEPMMAIDKEGRVRPPSRECARIRRLNALRPMRPPPAARRPPPAARRPPPACAAPLVCCSIRVRAQRHWRLGSAASHLGIPTHRRGRALCRRALCEPRRLPETQATLLTVYGPKLMAKLKPKVRGSSRPIACASSSGMASIRGGPYPPLVLGSMCAVCAYPLPPPPPPPPRSRSSGAGCGGH